MSKKKIQLPKQITQKLYVIYGTGRFNKGDVTVNTYPMHLREGDDTFAGILLAETEITIDIAQTEIGLYDIQKHALHNLRKRREGILARHHMELREVDDEISKIQAIEYQPDGAAA